MTTKTLVDTTDFADAKLCGYDRGTDFAIDGEGFRADLTTTDSGSRTVLIEGHDGAQIELSAVEARYLAKQILSAVSVEPTGSALFRFGCDLVRSGSTSAEAAVA